MLVERGFQHHRGTAAAVLSDFGRFSRIPTQRAGTRLRNVTGLGCLLDRNGMIGAIAASHLGNRVRPVRALLFDMSDASNRSLG